MTANKQMLTSEEAAAYIGIPTGTLAIYRTRGTGPKYYKPSNRKVLYKRDDIDAWLETIARQSTAEDRSPAEGKRRPGRPRKDAAATAEV